MLFCRIEVQFEQNPVLLLAIALGLACALHRSKSHLHKGEFGGLQTEKPPVFSLIPSTQAARTRTVSGEKVLH